MRNRTLLLAITLFILSFASCKRGNSKQVSESQSDTMIVTDSANLSTKDQDTATLSTSPSDTDGSEDLIEKESYADSLKRVTIASLLLHKNSIDFSSIELQTMMDEILDPYLNYETEIRFKEKTSPCPGLIEYQKDTFTINERQRFLAELCYTSSDMILMSEINFKDHNNIAERYARQMAKLPISLELDAAITKEFELWYELSEHEQATSKNILLGEYLDGPIYQVLQLGIMCDNMETAATSFSTLYFALNCDEFSLPSIPSIKDSIQTRRNEIKSYYKKLHSYLHEPDQLILEEEERIFNQLVRQHHKIGSLLKRSNREISEIDLLRIMTNKKDHLIFFCSELDPDQASQYDPEGDGV